MFIVYKPLCTCSPGKSTVIGWFFCWTDCLCLSASVEYPLLLDDTEAEGKRICIYYLDSFYNNIYLFTFSVSWFVLNMTLLLLCLHLLRSFVSVKYSKTVNPRTSHWPHTCSLSLVSIWSLAIAGTLESLLHGIAQTRSLSISTCVSIRSLKLTLQWTPAQFAALLWANGIIMFSCNRYLRCETKFCSIPPSKHSFSCTCPYTLTCICTLLLFYKNQ